MPILSTKSEKSWIWIPPVAGVSWKMEIVGTDTTDITDIVLSGSIDDGATETIGSFNVTLANHNGTYNDKWSGNEQVKFYADYAATASTLRFLGRIDKVSYTNNTIVITGRSEAVAYLGVTVTKQYTNQEASTVLTNLISAYSSGFTTVNVVASTTNMTVNWYQKPFWDCVKEICSSSSSDAYIDSSKDWHFFRERTVNNTTEAIVHGMNLVSTGQFGYDKSQIRNRIVVYGQDIDGTPLVYTAEDQDSHDSLNRWQEEIINDTNITTYAQAQQRGDYELSIKKDPPIVGDLTSIGLPNLAPGERLRISDPDNNIPPGHYRVIAFKHKFGHDMMMQTTATIEKTGTVMSGILKDVKDIQQNLADLANPYEKRYSYNFSFASILSGETYSNTELSDSRLKLTSGSTGTFVSATRTTLNDITSVHVKAVGDAIPGTVFEVSNDNGINWQVIPLNADTAMTNSGNSLKLRITINSASTQIDGVAVLYR